MMSFLIYFVNHSITEQILQPNREISNLTSFVDDRYKTPIEEIQTVVYGAVSAKQSVKLRQSLNHIHDLEIRKVEIK